MSERRKGGRRGTKATELVGEGRTAVTTNGGIVRPGRSGGGRAAAAGSAFTTAASWSPESWEYGVRNLHEDPNDEPHRSGMGEDEARRWVRLFDVAGREDDNPWRVVKRPRGPWIEAD